MNKQELIGHVADRAGLNRNDAVRAVETMLEVIMSALKRGDEVRLVGFGNFSVTRRKPSTSLSRNSTRFGRSVSASCRAMWLILASALIASVTSSCVVTQPPSGSG